MGLVEALTEFAPVRRPLLTWMWAGSSWAPSCCLERNSLERVGVAVQEWCNGQENHWPRL